MYKRITLFILCLLLLPSISFAKVSKVIDNSAGIVSSEAWFEDEKPYKLKCFWGIILKVGWVPEKPQRCILSFVNSNKSEYKQFAIENAILKLNNDTSQIYSLPYRNREAEQMPYQGKMIDVMYVVAYEIPESAMKKLAVANSATITIKTESKKEITYDVDPKLLVEWKQVLNDQKIE